MKLISLLTVMTSLTLVGVFSARAQKTGGEYLAEVETKWPGVRFAIHGSSEFKTIVLLVVVRVLANSKAERSGTFLGTKTEIPPGVSKEEIASGRYNRAPLTLASRL